MANRDIFCNSPWVGLHIYWDGSFGACCSEKHHPYPENEKDKYNLKTMNVSEWYNSDVMKTFRLRMLGDKKLTNCVGCYFEDANGYDSRRVRENFKSVIFTRQAFEKSYNQSPWHDRFESAKQMHDVDLPIDIHIDLGNECNLACKMCKPQASSLIASYYKKWNLELAVRRNWVNDPECFENFKGMIDELKIRRIHFMGGEPTIGKSFKEILTHLIEANKTDLSVSFVSNGTNIDSELIDMLAKFNTVNVEISIESVNARVNDYIRQRSSTQHVLGTIKRLAAIQTENFQVVLRSVPQLLNVVDYHDYISWAWDHKIAIQGNPLVKPEYLQIKVLPKTIRMGLIKRYDEVRTRIASERTTVFETMAVGRDVSRLDIQLIQECDSVIRMLTESEPDNVDVLRQELIVWLNRWDQEFKFNAAEIYPEFADFLINYGYKNV